MLIQRILVGDSQRALVYVRGRFQGILEPGAYILWALGRSLEVEVHSTLTPELVSPRAAALAMLDHPAIAESFVRVAPGEGRVAAVFIDGVLARVLGPGRRALFWKAPSQVEVREFDALAEPLAPAPLAIPLARLGGAAQAKPVMVPEQSIALVFISGKLVLQLPPGFHAVWEAGPPVRVELVDLRRQVLDVSGQEILTRDKVTLRVNVSAEFAIADPVAAVTVCKSAQETLYRLLQLAVRRTLGVRTLDELLTEKVDIDPAAAESVRAEMALAGVTVSAIAIKDVILPGEIRDILIQVVAAEKQAQANLIRRREETAATRSLLNTARLMEGSPVLMRLKELETLEKLTEKVGSVTVTGGFEGMLEKLLPAGRK
jgi:regulator of protease activity HflC (stomatin/prohibitin superfamily)